VLAMSSLFPAADSLGRRRRKVAVNDFVLMASTTTLAGITLASYYKLTAVDYGMSITVAAGTNATSSVTGGGSISLHIFGVGDNRQYAQRRQLCRRRYPRLGGTCGRSQQYGKRDISGIRPRRRGKCPATRVRRRRSSIIGRTLRAVVINNR
jgi:hypothetical protein